MPIRKELRQFYGAEWHAVVRPRILRRAGGRFTRAGRYLGGAHCEHCGRPDRRRVFTLTHRQPPARQMFWLYPEYGDGVWVDQHGRPAPELRLRGLPRKVFVLLSVAHLNHVAGDDRDENLRALCAWCHLTYDLVHHRETRCHRKDAERPLLVALENVREAEPRRGEFADELDYCRAMQRWAVAHGTGPLQNVCLNDWFSEELLLLEERWL